MVFLENVVVDCLRAAARGATDGKTMTLYLGKAGRPFIFGFLFSYMVVNYLRGPWQWAGLPCIKNPSELTMLETLSRALLGMHVLLGSPKMTSTQARHHSLKVPLTGNCFVKTCFDCARAVAYAGTPTSELKETTPWPKRGRLVAETSANKAQSKAVREYGGQDLPPGQGI
jgi:hypothetical protein